MKAIHAPKKRVTLRTIAEASGVSVMTVSYALRESAEVSLEVRRRVRKIADSLGYRPDPLLTHLMQHLRSQRKLKSAPNLAILTSLSARFVQRLISGAITWAERLGYHVDVIDVRAFRGRPAATLTRMLEARGVTGILLAPASDPISYGGLVDWSRFAVVAMTYSVIDPHVHRVVTHHFDNALRTFALLEDRGVRRIGLAMTHDMEFRAHHSYSAAYYRMIGMAAAERLPILFVDDVDKRAVRTWVAQNTPAAIVVANAHQVKDFILSAVSPHVAREITFMCLDYEEEAGISGIDQLFERIGIHSIDALVAQIHRNERGLPENPTTTMVEGRWIDASTSKKRSPRSSARAAARA